MILAEILRPLLSRSFRDSRRARISPLSIGFLPENIRGACAPRHALSSLDPLSASTLASASSLQSRFRRSGGIQCSNVWNRRRGIFRQQEIFAANPQNVVLKGFVNTYM